MSPIHPPPVWLQHLVTQTEALSGPEPRTCWSAFCPVRPPFGPARGGLTWCTPFGVWLLLRSVRLPGPPVGQRVGAHSYPGRVLPRGVGEPPSVTQSFVGRWACGWFPLLGGWALCRSERVCAQSMGFEPHGRPWALTVGNDVALGPTRWLLVRVPGPPAELPRPTPFCHHSSPALPPSLLPGNGSWPSWRLPSLSPWEGQIWGLGGGPG